MPIHEGVIWFLFATIGQLPAAVRLCPSRTSHSYLSPFTSQVLILLNLNRMLWFSPLHQRQLFIVLDSVQNDSSIKSRMSLIL